MNIDRFNRVIEVIGLLAAGLCMADEISRRGWVGWILAIAAYWGVHVILDDRAGLRHELDRRNSS